MRLFIASLSTILLISCNTKTNTFTLEGNAFGFEDGTEVYVYTFENNQSKPIDTMTVMDEKFSTTFPKSDITPPLHFLSVKDVRATFLFFPENENMFATIYKDSIKASRITGGKQNDAYSGFVDKIDGFNKRKQARMDQFQTANETNDTAAIAKLQSDNLNLIAEETAYKKQFLSENNNSIFSIMLITDMTNRKEITSAEAMELYNNLTPAIAATEMGKKLKSNLDAMSDTEIGSKAPNFSAPTPSGEMLSLKEAMGKYTIIDFWASWCRPCRIENPNVVAVYNDYHDKGLNIIGVSLDKPNERDKWLQAIEDDKLDWHHVSNLNFWNDPIVKKYSINAIPATFLLDENGVIIDKNLRGEALRVKMKTLFAE